MSWLDSLNSTVSNGTTDPAGQKVALEPEQVESIAVDLITMASFGAAVVTLVPIPLSDFVAVTAVQASMVTAIGRVHGRRLDFDESKHLVLELASVCGVSLLAQKGFATLTKLFLPGLGGALAAPWAFAVTWGMGQAAHHYFRHRQLTRTALKTVFDQGVKQAKNVFTKEKFDAFKKKHGSSVEEFVREQSTPPPAPPRPGKKKKLKKKLKKKPSEP